MKKVYKIYCLINPINYDIFYIGKTCVTLEARLKGHLAQSNILNYNKKDMFVYVLKIQGFIPIIKELYECSESENSNEVEKKFIEDYSKNHNLLNIMNLGNQYYPFTISNPVNNYITDYNWNKKHKFKLKS